MECLYAIAKLSNRSKKSSKFLKKIGTAIVKALKFIMVAPFLPCILFFILVDKILRAVQKELDEYRRCRELDQFIVDEYESIMERYQLERYD